MVPPKPAFYILLLLLAFLGSAQDWPGSQSCSIQEVLRHYQAVIFQDLQAAMQWAGLGVQHTEPGSRRHRFIQKNLTGAGGGQGQPGTSCDAQKVWGRFPQTTICFLLKPHPHSPCSGFPPFPTQESSILLSIESLGQTLLGSVAGVPHNALEKAAWTVAVRTEAVMRRHCRTSFRMQQPKKHAVQPRSRRRLLLRALYAVATCWEKLFALSAMATGEF
ncbi:uncharacterized protein C20orf204 homolog isoform X1 [Apodemus sylvaticus]|uniref:uncharacterized protein C20orf204 homolog isoform X1 n=1 Tax=Apodemus sylvaticus TaxID=10129 RepID=UPI002244AE78|nr:uncharacterized protein C20orf204 homolog isoform X1 [Apodemus sylvaticus]